ncbi:MAG TPA: hypothetical protein VGT05_00495 [Patescibacteria group bacterium]|nr:hypothetical protein [Patescibacteria group bacterium]
MNVIHVECSPPVDIVTTPRLTKTIIHAIAYQRRQGITYTLKELEAGRWHDVTPPPPDLSNQKTEKPMPIDTSKRIEVMSDPDEVGGSIRFLERRSSVVRLFNKLVGRRDRDWKVAKEPAPVEIDEDSAYPIGWIFDEEGKTELRTIIHGVIFTYDAPDNSYDDPVPPTTENHLRLAQ